MSDTSSPSESKALKQALAAAANNRGWDLVEAENRTEDEVCDMLNAVHAACWLWRAVGTDLQHARAEVLVAAAHAQAGLVETALRYGQNGWAVIEQSDPEDWEIALTQGIRAQVFAAAGHTSDHDQSLAAAQAAFDRLPEGPNRDIVGRSLRNVLRITKTP